MEKRDLYDTNRNLTGETIYKGEETPSARYILVVLAFIQNSKGELLIQKRSKQKGGKYAFTGGHPKSGETSLQGMITEIQEELGLTILESELNLVSSEKYEKEKRFLDIYYLKRDFNISDLILQKEEVDSAKWLSVEEVKQLIDNDLFFDRHLDHFYTFENLYNNGGLDFE